MARHGEVRVEVPGVLQEARHLGSVSAASLAGGSACGEALDTCTGRPRRRRRVVVRETPAGPESVRASKAPGGIPAAGTEPAALPEYEGTQGDVEAAKVRTPMQLRSDDHYNGGHMHANASGVRIVWRLRGRALRIRAARTTRPSCKSCQLRRGGR